MAKQPNPPSGDRLQKVLAHAGVASRRHAERMIRAGRVSVNGKTITEMGTRVQPRDSIKVDGNPVHRERKLWHLVMNKAPGTISSVKDPEGRRCVVDKIPKEKYGRVYPVGRLDWNTEGVLLLTNDGDLAHKLTHPSYGIERVYAVKVRGHLQNEEKLDAIAQGVRLGNGRLATVDGIQMGQRTEKNTWIEIRLHEGRNREIRQICEAVGLTVQRLIRVSFGGITFGHLRSGKYREMSLEEVQSLREQVQGPTSNP
jgi:pseudouridine synthase